MLAKLDLLQKLRTMKLSVGSCAVRGIDEVKAKNVLPFGRHSHKRTQTQTTFYLQNTANNFIHQMCVGAKYHEQYNLSKVDFKSEEQNCVFMNGL